MKKRLLLVVAVVSMAVGLVSCGKTNDVSTNQSETQAQEESQAQENDNGGNYSEDFDAIIERLDKLNDSSNFLSAFVVAAWSEAGPDHISEVILDILDAYDDSSYKLAFNWIPKLSLDLGLSYSDEQEEFCKKFQEQYKFVFEEKDNIQEAVLDLKNNYSDEHGDAISALSDYYITCSTYGELALDPKGNLNSYSQDISDYKNKIIEEKKKVELAK